MSLLTKASTVTTPTAYDGGVLNSVKPVSRENLLLQSNQFDTTWLDITLTKTGGQSGYDGTNDAWELECNAASSRLYQTSLSVSGVQTYSVYAKAGTLDYIGLIVAGTGAYAYFDIANGQLGATNVNTIDHKIQSVGGGWYRCSIAYTGTTTAVRIYPAQADNDTAQTSGNIYIQDAQLQKGITATQYVETTTAAVQNGDFSFARASAATRVNEQGLIEKERGNLILQSNQFDTTWAFFNLSVTSGQSGYNKNDAWLLECTTTASSARMTQGITASGVLSLSFYAKAGTTDSFALRSDDSATAAWFNLSSGEVHSTAGSVIDAQIQNIGNGWYRCNVVYNSSVSARIYISDNVGVYSVTDGANIYIQDAQLEQGLVATDYIETTTTAVYEGITDNIPRINYEGGNGSFLLEPQRTNLITYSEDYSQSEWTNAPATQLVNVTFNSSSVSPYGSNGVYQVEATSANGQIGAVKIISSGVNYSSSFYIRRISGTGRIYFININNVPTEITNDLTSSWKRFDLSALSTSTNGRCYIKIETSGDIIEVWGAQLEQGSYATSYIPTFGTSVTRVAETCNNAGDSSLFNDSEGVLYAEIAALVDDATFRFISIVNGTQANNQVKIGYDTTSSTLRIACRGAVTGTYVKQIPIDNILNSNKIALKYKANDFATWINGYEYEVQLSGTSMPSGMDNLRFEDGDGTNDFYGKTKMVATFKEALSDSELECLTSWSSFNRMATAQNYTIQ